jgi:two-component system chemotaxis sensor kinase CheA
VLGLRMVPVESVFKKMIRLVHDQSSKSGKKARLELRGGKTEVDKNIAELVADPLVHMIRNAVDHGIETPEERAAAGKPPVGTVILEAKQEGSDICITLSDDGKGLDRGKILRKALEKGLVKGNPADLKEEDIFQFIFAPGFSTAESITSTSGRGVGMDVVKNNVDKLKGKILIHSRPGRGAVIDLRIPLTLSIIEGMEVRVGASQCIIPLTAIKETLSPSIEQVTHVGEDEEVFFLRGRLYPILRLNRLYNIPGGRADLEDGVLLLIEARDISYCLFVDELMGMRQTVVKSLPGFLGNIPGASGCSILANGEICLILDVEALALKQQQAGAAVTAAADSRGEPALGLETSANG